MADEDGPLTHGRDLHAYLDEIQAKQPNRAEALEILRGIQMAVPVDDARHLVRPITVPVGHFFVQAAAGGAGTHSGVLITPVSGSGCYVTFLYPVATGHAVMSEGIPVFTPAGAAVDPLVVPGDDPTQTVVHDGTTGVIAANSGVRLVQNVGYLGCPFFIPRGRQVLVYNEVANTVMRAFFGIQDIP